MARDRKPSQQTVAVLDALAGRPGAWLYGLEIARATGLKSGTIYPILIRCAETGLLESKWLEPAATGRPPRHAYRILPKGTMALEAARAIGTSLGPRVRMA
jgi:DNA-binding PadR family transcriptional regulator